jgi:hypothetical protein
MQQAANPRECSMKPQYIVLRDASVWGLDRQFVGCVPRPLRQPPTSAPTDLRTVALPVNWNTSVQFRLTSGLTEYIPNLPPNLEFLYIGDNQIKELPPLPNTIRYLVIDNNKIPSIQNIPTACVEIEARNNLLDKLPTPLSPVLERIYLTHNFFEELPSFEMTRLQSAGLGFNRLKSLPKFPETLEKLGCQNNNLTEITDLPGQLRFFNCSNNRDLKTLRIENLRRIETFIAANCGLTQIPILPIPFGQTDEDENEDENENENENNNNQAGGYRGFEPRYIFSGNPLEPEFKRLADNYENGEISWPKFRKGVIRAHQRRIAAQKQTLGALQQVFKPATGRTTEMSPAEQVFSNYGPGNIIASFITGKPGTLEAQKLALVANQEKYKAVPEGAADVARAKIANIAFQAPAEGNTEEEKARKRLLQERAKLYVGKSNIAEAAERYKKKMEELEKQRLIDAETAKYLTPLREATLALGNEYDSVTKELDQLYEQIQMAGSGGLKLIRERFISWFPEQLGALIEGLQKGTEENANTFSSLVQRTLRNKALRKLARLIVEKQLLLHQMDKIADFSDIYKGSPSEFKELAQFQPALFKDGKEVAETIINNIRKITETMFPVERSDANLASINLDDLFKQVRDLMPSLKISTDVKNFIYVKDDVVHFGAPRDRGDFPDEELRRGLEMAREAEQEYVDVINNNEENSEAMRHALVLALVRAGREAAERGEVEDAEEAVAAAAQVAADEDEEEGKVEQDEEEEENFVDWRRRGIEFPNENENNNEENYDERQGMREFMAWRHRKDGGKRQNITPRKRKSQRQSRKH